MIAKKEMGKTQKISNKDIVSLAVMGLAVVVLVKLYNTAEQYEKIAKDVNTSGLRSVL